MSDTRDQVIDYISERYAREDSLLKNILLRQLEGGGPMMNVGPDQGKFIYLLILLLRSQNVLELGSYYGYSSIWLARAVRELDSQGFQSRLTCLEKSATYAEIVKENLIADGLESYADLVQGEALVILDKFVQQKKYFDLIFVDADKANYSNYLDLAAKLLLPGGCLLVDNTLWSNRVLEGITADKQTKAIQEFNDKLSRSEDFDAVLLTIQDGLTLALRK
jgi:caffeoyl-CoA O-methyltransferase